MYTTVSYLKVLIKCLQAKGTLTNNLDLAEGKVLVVPRYPHSSSLQSVEREDKLLVLVLVDKPADCSTVH